MKYFGTCRECSDEDEELFGEDRLCKRCDLDAQYAVSVDVVAADEEASKCWRCGVLVENGDPFCDACYMPSAEDRWDERNHVEYNPEDDWT